MFVARKALCCQSLLYRELGSFTPPQLESGNVVARDHIVGHRESPGSHLHFHLFCYKTLL